MSQQFRPGQEQQQEGNILDYALKQSGRMSPFQSQPDIGGNPLSLAQATSCRASLKNNTQNRGNKKSMNRIQNTIWAPQGYKQGLLRFRG